MEHPGAILKAQFLDPIGVTPYALAKGIGVQQTRISQILKGKRAISADTAVRLGAFFGVPARWFLDLQVAWDLTNAESAAEGISRHPGRYWVRPSGARPLGPSAAASPRMVRVDPDEARAIREQADLAGARATRRGVEVRYEDGSRALVSEPE